MEFESAATRWSKSMGLTADDPATEWGAAGGRIGTRALRCGGRDRMPSRAARADRRRTRRARVLPSAAAALIGRRLAAARPLRSGRRGDRQGRRLDGVVSQPGLGCAMTAAYLEPEAACEIFGGPRGILAWAPGPGTARVVEDGYLVTATWKLCQRQPPHHRARLPCLGCRGRRNTAAQRRWQPGHPHDAVP